MNDPQVSSSTPALNAAAPRRKLVAWLLGGLAVGSAALLTGLIGSLRPTATDGAAQQRRGSSRPESRGPGSIEQTRALDQQNRPLNPGYIGIEACGKCHADRVAEFKTTRHWKACCEPDPAAMPAVFGTGNSAYSTRDLRFEMTRSGSDFFETAIRKTPQGEQSTKSRIGLVYGAGAKSDEVYLTWHGDLLYELPIVWLEPQQIWGASAFLPFGKGDFSRELTPRCLECHNTWFEHAPGTLNQYRRETAVLSISCEKCHGPGREHAAWHAAHPGETSGAAIVRPALLSRQRKIDLCAQCHSNAITYRRRPFTYQAGKPLGDYFRTLQTKYPEDDHVANQVSYLRESKCFQRSETLTCTTCHDPHRPRAVGVEAAQSACLNCHQPIACGARERLPSAVRDNCVDCHMPVSKKVQVFFQTEHEEFVSPVNRWEHRIAIYPAAEQELLLAWHRTQDGEESRTEIERLTDVLDDYWNSEGDRCRQQARFLPAIYAYRQALQLNSASKAQEKLLEAVNSKRKLGDAWEEAYFLIAKNQVAEAIPVLENALKIDPQHAKIHGKLGAAYAATGQIAPAIEHLEAATRYDPDDPYGPGMLGWLAYLAGKPDEALRYYRLAEEREPYNAKINFEIGLALSQLGRWPDAEARFRQALDIDPNHVDACQAYSQSLRQLGRAEEAIPYALGAARLTDYRSLDALIELAQAYASAGRSREAGETAAKALAASQSSKTLLEPEIRLQLELLEDRGKRTAPPED